LVGSQDIEIVQALPAIFFPLVRFDFASFDLASFAIPPSAGDEVQGQWAKPNCHRPEPVEGKNTTGSK
jgi:hypothetical protein